MNDLAYHEADMRSLADPDVTKSQVRRVLRHFSENVKLLPPDLFGTALQAMADAIVTTKNARNKAILMRELLNYLRLAQGAENPKGRQQAPIINLQNLVTGSVAKDVDDEFRRMREDEH